jgi:hypothetical protein
MVNRTVRSFAALVVLAAPPGVQQTDSPQVRLGGFWAGGGLGGVSAGINCDLCVGERTEGFSGFLSAGLALPPKVRLAARAQRLIAPVERAGVDDGAPTIGDDRQYAGPGTRGPH